MSAVNSSRKIGIVKGGIGGTIGGGVGWKLGKIKKSKTLTPGGARKLKNKSKVGFQFVVNF